MKNSSNRKLFNWCWNDRSVDAQTLQNNLHCY